jgi:hypothetical protein
MSSNNNQNNSEELDLSLITDKIRGLYHSALISLYKIFNFFIKSWIVILVLIAIGATLGYFKTNDTPERETKLYVRVNGNSGAIVYDALNQLQFKIQEKDSVLLEKKGFFKNSIYFIHSLEIEPLVNILEIIDATEANNRNLETVMDQAQYEDELLTSEVFIPQYRYHKITLTGDYWSSQKTIDELVLYLNDNPVLIKQNDLIKESLAFRIARNFESISFMDSIFDTYGRPISELTKDAASEFSMVDINVTNIHMLFEQKSLLMEQNEKLQLHLLNQDKTVSLINKPMLAVKKSILDIKMLTYPIYLIILFVLLSMMRYYFHKAKALSRQQNILETESTDKLI